LRTDLLVAVTRDLEGEIDASALGQRRQGAERLEGLDRIVERARIGDYLVPVAVVSA
jgi:hypothetical protein